MTLSVLESLFLAVLLAGLLALFSLFRYNLSREPTREPILFDECQTLYEAVMDLPNDVQWYSQPSELRNLPFLTLHRAVQRDRFNFVSGNRFSYIGREKFPDIVAKIERMLTFGRAEARKLNIYGTVGYGKSHILAALACYFTRRGHAVVYIPDSEILLWAFPASMRWAFLCACSHPSLRHHWPEIMKIRSTDDVIRVSSRLKGLVFIIDQFNAVNIETKDLELEKQLQVAESLKRLMAENPRNILIESASANSRSYSKIGLGYHRLDDTILLFGGMSAAEMSAWWLLRERQGQLPDFTSSPDDASSPNSSSSNTSPNSSTTHISAQTSAAILHSQIEYMTGCIPLLLAPLLNFHGKHFEDIAHEYWTHPTLRRVQQGINEFVRDCRNLDNFYGIISIFLRGDLLMEQPDSRIDRRYLYQDEKYRTHIICGIAREALAVAVRRGAPRIALDDSWADALFAQRENPAVLGFLVEQRCISSIANRGLAITAGLSIPATPVISFPGDIVPVLRTGFYVPIKPNCMAIDCVYATVDDRNNTANIVPIQITIAKKHSDSEAKFFQHLGKWTESLTGFDIKVTFVWIKEETGSDESLEMSTRRLRGRCRG